MQRLLITWEISSQVDGSMNRYCHGCGRKVNFTDSLKRRKNANGKMIYEYAIYKCEKEHTWNRLLKTYHAKHYDPKQESDCRTVNTASVVDKIITKDCSRMGFTEIEIFIKKIEGDWRLDKLLARYMEGTSRSQIEKYIREGKILVDNEVVKTKTMIREGQVIVIILDL